jgi:alpha-L-rhamnosidase
MKYVFFIRFSLLACLTSLSTFCGAQPNIKTDWQAQWIGADTPSAPNTFLRFRKQINLEQQPSKATLSIATDSKYWLWINGKMVVFEGQLKRGPTPNDTYYDVLDISRYLKKGNNMMAVLVWYWGKDGFCHKSSGKAGLLFELHTHHQIFLSDSNCKQSKHLSYQNSQPPHPNFRLPEHNIHYDARLDNERWIDPNYNDRDWKQASLLGKAGTAPWNVLWKRPIPLWYDSGLQPYRDTATVNGKLSAQLPRNITVSPYFKIEAPAGLFIDIRTDNYYGGSEPNVRTEYITRAGVQEFETPGYMNGHTVHYQFPPGVKVLDVKYRETKYNTEYVGLFQCNDAFYNSLWQKSANTLNVNMRDAIQDPDRERAQWWGDAVIILEEIFYCCDRNAWPAITKSISNLLEWQKPDGTLFSPIPAGNWDKELPAQMLASIGTYGIGKYILHSGDTAFIRYAYPFVKKYMQLWRLDEKGLVQHRAGGWDWHDWGDKIDVPLLDNAWYYMALESCHRMASYLKLTTDAEQYQQQMQRIKKGFRQYFWKGNRFASDDYKFIADDRANGLAVCAGLVTPQQWPAIKPMLDTTFHAGPYLEKYILEAYFIMNDAQGGLSRMKKRYAKMVNHPTITTLWEGWEIGSSTYGGGTYNHGWSGGPLSLLSGYVCGLQPATPGYGHYTILPQMGSLRVAQSRSLTPKGMVQVAIEKKERQLVMTIQTPGTSGIIGLPKSGNSAYKNITINGQRQHPVFKKSREDDRYIYFRCNRAGKWTVKATW